MKKNKKNPDFKEKINDSKRLLPKLMYKLKLCTNLTRYFKLYLISKGLLEDFDVFCRKEIENYDEIEKELNS